MKASYKHLLIVLLAACSHLLSYGSDSSRVSILDTTHIAITFKSGEFTLHGKLVLPQSPQRVPAVVFLVGSGGETSYRTNYKEWCEENLEKQLLPEGVAILYFDKRGVPPSDGKWFNTDFEQRAEDAKAALDFLKKQPGIDSTKLGVIGHGHGAWVAQVVASRYPNDLAFGISLAGAPFGIKKQLVSDYRGELLCSQIDPDEAQKMAERKAAATIKLSNVPTNDFLRHIKLIKDFEPASYIKAIENPFLFLFAENDEVADAEWCEKDLKALFPTEIPAHLEYQIVPEANHSFRRAPMCYDQSWDDMPYSEEYQHVLRNWLIFQLQIMHNQQAAVKIDK